MSGRIRVMQVVASLTVGGAERLLPGLLQGLDPRRFAVQVCSLGGGPIRDELDRLGLAVAVLNARRFYTPYAALALTRAVRAFAPDVIHTHLTDADVVGRLVGAALRIPVVSTLHNVPEDYDRQKPHRRLLQRATLPLATRLVAVSESIRAAYIADWRVAPGCIDAIRNAVPLQPYLALPAGVPGGGDGPVIVNIAKLFPQKAQHILIDAARIVLAQVPAARFRIVGQGPLEAQLRAQAAALGIADKVELLGVRRDIPQILAASDIFTLSSAWEGLPVTAVEAMAAARACVLTDVGGARDLIDDGRQGLIVPPGDAPALAAALVALLRDAPRREAMGLAAREKVRAEFSLERYAGDHARLYEAMAARRRQAVPTISNHQL